MLVGHCLTIASCEIGPDDSCSNVGGSTVISAGTSVALAKKINNTVAMAKQRLATLDGTAEMEVGKLGVERYQASLTIQAFDKDPQKKNLREVLDLKSTYKDFLEIEKIAPENIGECSTPSIGTIITLALKRWKVPPAPYKVYVFRISTDHSRVACQSEANVIKYLIVVFPFFTSYVPAGAVWQIPSAVYNCLCPIPRKDRCDIYDEHFLEFFTEIVKQQGGSTVIMVCKVVNLFLTEALEREVELEDQEAKLLFDYQEICRMTPRAFEPCSMLVDGFWDILNETLDFFSHAVASGTKEQNIRFKSVSVAAQDHAEVQTALVDMNATQVNREMLETSVTKLVSMKAWCSEALTSDADSDRDLLQVDLVASCTDALGHMQHVQKNLAATFLPLLDQQVKAAASELCSKMCADERTLMVNRKLLDAMQKLVSECCCIWPFESDFIDQQKELANRMRSLSATQDKQSAVDMLAAQCEENFAISVATAKEFVEKVKLVDLKTLEPKCVTMCISGNINEACPTVTLQ